MKENGGLGASLRYWKMPFCKIGDDDFLIKRHLYSLKKSEEFARLQAESYIMHGVDVRNRNSCKCDMLININIQKMDVTSFPRFTRTPAC